MLRNIFLRSNGRDREYDDKYEICVCCKKRTNVLRAEEVDRREFFVGGVGQLCEACFMEIQYGGSIEEGQQFDREMRKLLLLCREEKELGE